jgi:hypothetical protein
MSTCAIPRKRNMRKSRRKGDRALVGDVKPKRDAGQDEPRPAIRIEVSLDESWDREYEEGIPAIELPPRGKGNRPSWRLWNPDPIVGETNCVELIRRDYPKPLFIGDIPDELETQTYLGEPSFTFRLACVPTLTAEALTKIHPCLLYRLLWLDGLVPGEPIAVNRRLGAIIADAQTRILSPRAARDASKRDRLFSARAKLHAANAHSKRRVLRQHRLKQRRNNTKDELRVIDYRLRLLKRMLRWSDGKIGRLVIESPDAWNPAPCPERVRRWVTDEGGGDGKPDPRKAEEWVRTRRRARN